MDDLNQKVQKLFDTTGKLLCRLEGLANKVDFVPPLGARGVARGELRSVDDYLTKSLSYLVECEKAVDRLNRSLFRAEQTEQTEQTIGYTTAFGPIPDLFYRAIGGKQYIQLYDEHGTLLHTLPDTPENAEILLRMKKS